MKRFVAFVAFVLASSPCCCRSVMETEQSVVSVYTTLPTTAGVTAPLDVYHQIANNIAERITSPIYRFLGIENRTEEEKTTKKPWDKIEILDDPADLSKSDLKPVGNDIPPRDVEELSVEALRRPEKKPEKITLFSSYLPASEPLKNNTIELDDDDDFFNLDDDDEQEKPREGPLIYILEFFGSVFQLLSGGLAALFSSSSSSSQGTGSTK